MVRVVDQAIQIRAQHQARNLNFGYTSRTTLTEKLAGREARTRERAISESIRGQSSTQRNPIVRLFLYYTDYFYIIHVREEIYRTLQKPERKKFAIERTPIPSSQPQNVNAPNRPHYGTSGRIPTGS